MFDKASESLHKLSATVGDKIEQLAASHEEFQASNPIPNQHTSVVIDAEQDYADSQDSAQQEIQRDLNRVRGIVDIQDGM